MDAPQDKPPADGAEEQLSPKPIRDDFCCLACGCDLRGLSGEPVRCPECGGQNSLADLADGAEDGLSASGPIDCDLYCVECGYNLRGLSGDPVRCPECGHQNPLSDVTLPAELTRAQLRRLESAPALGLGAMLGFFCCWLGILSAATGVFGSARSEDGLLPCSSFGVIGFGVGWAINLQSFRDSCMGRPGWLRAWFVYQAWGLLLLVVGVGAPVLAGVLLGMYGGTLEGYSYGVLGTFVAGALVGAYCIHPRAKAAIQPLQREVAVHIAGKTLRMQTEMERVERETGVSVDEQIARGSRTLRSPTGRTLGAFRGCRVAEAPSCALIAPRAAVCCGGRSRVVDTAASREGDRHAAAQCSISEPAAFDRNVRGHVLFLDHLPGLGRGLGGRHVEGVRQGRAARLGGDRPHLQHDHLVRDRRPALVVGAVALYSVRWLLCLHRSLPRPGQSVWKRCGIRRRADPRAFRLPADAGIRGEPIPGPSARHGVM